MVDKWGSRYLVAPVSLLPTFTNVVMFIGTRMLRKFCARWQRGQERHGRYYRPFGNMSVRRVIADAFNREGVPSVPTRVIHASHELRNPHIITA